MFDSIFAKFTSKNLTVAGILVILIAAGQAAVALMDGKPETVVNLEVLWTQIMLGAGMIASKGAASTGGVVPETSEAAKRIDLES